MYTVTDVKGSSLSFPLSPHFPLVIHLIQSTNSAPGAAKQTFTNGWRTTSTPTPSSNTSPPKLYRTTRFSKQRVQRLRKDKKWREIKATNGWLVSRGKRIPRRIRKYRGNLRVFFFHSSGTVFVFKCLLAYFHCPFMNKEIKEPPPQAIIKTVIIPKDPYCSCIVVSEDSIILSYTLYILILNIITHPITLHAKLREEKQCHIPDHLMYVHPFPPFSPSYTRPHLHQ